MFAVLIHITISFIIVVIICIATIFKILRKKVRKKSLEAGELPVQRSLWARCDDPSGRLELPWGWMFSQMAPHLCAENVRHAF